MLNMPREATPLLRLALAPLARARTAEVGSVFELRSFQFSYWVGVGILLRDRPCSSDVVGQWRRMLHIVFDQLPGSLLDFIDVCTEVRLDCVTSGNFDADRIRVLQRRGVRALCHALVSTFGVSRIEHPSRDFDSLVTFLGWLKRLPICVRDARDSAAEYIENDERLGKSLHRCVPELRQIWEEWFRNFTLRDPFLPKHGSGSTADVGKVKADKYRALQIDALARVGLRFPDLSDALSIPLGNPSRVAKVVFVPKQAGKDRTICMEPAWLQYLQQGVAERLVAYTHSDSHPMSKLVDIFDQGRNRCLCAAAYYRRLATIDLTNASDSVSWELIKALTKGMPIYRYLLATRSTHFSLQGEVYQQRKFAPMGSALCFIIESTLFSSIVEHSYRKHYGKAFASGLKGCSVYGDDIIVPSALYQRVVDTLECLGFTVNSQKSYSDGIYRESCGVEYIRGDRISTLRHPRKHLLREVMSPDDIDMVTDIANSLLEFGAKSARTLLLKYYLSKKIRVRRKLYAFSDFIHFGQDGVLSVNESRPNLSWNCAYQEWGSSVKSVQTHLRHTSQDFVDYQHSLRPTSRDQRIRRRKCLPRQIRPHDKWSTKAILLLSGMRHFALLEAGEIESRGSSGTGRPHHGVRTQFKPCGQK